LVAAACAFTTVFQAAAEKLHLEFPAVHDRSSCDEVLAKDGERKEIAYGPSNSLFMAVVQVFGFFPLLSTFLCRTVENFSVQCFFVHHHSIMIKIPHLKLPLTAKSCK